MSDSPLREPGPRFHLGQAVTIISNNGGLYAAQIGVTGAILKARQKRRYGDRRYDVRYRDARGREKIVIVAEGDLEALGETLP